MHIPSNLAAHMTTRFAFLHKAQSLYVQRELADNYNSDKMLIREVRMILNEPATHRTKF